MKNIVKVIDIILGTDSKIYLGSAYTLSIRIDKIKSSMKKNLPVQPSNKPKQQYHNPQLISYKLLNQFN